MCNLEHEGEVLEVPGVRERLDIWGEQLMDNPMTRRSLLGLLGVTVAQGLAVANRWPRAVTEMIAINEMRLGSHEYLDPTTTTTSSTTTTTTTATPLPPPPAPAESVMKAAGMETDDLNPDQKMQRIRDMIMFLPGLQELSTQKPNVSFFQNIPEKMAHLERLRRETNVSTDEYYHTVVNESLVGVFRGHKDYGTRIQPRLTVVHWTVDFPEGGMSHLPEGMKKRGVNYHGVVDKITDGKTEMYRFFDEDFPRMGAHAYHANQLGRGYAMMAACLEDIHPLQMKEIIKTIVRDHRMNNLPIDHTTVVSHFATDLILNNASFNPSTRLAATYGKFDIPQEAINIIVEKAQALDAALGPRP
jgi:hypothetical protein